MTRAQGKHREFSLNQSVATLIVGEFATFHSEYATFHNFFFAKVIFGNKFDIYVQRLEK